MTRYAILFPGQGSQTVGMARDVFAARSDLLGEAASDILGWDLSALAVSGPEDELTRTDRAQPALYAACFALWEEFRAATANEPAAAAGHSLGEYTALAAAGAVDYWQGLRLVAARGVAMSRAAALAPSGMAALLGADLAAAQALCAARADAGGRLAVANINAPGQVIVAGSEDDLAWLAENAASHGVRRAVPLKVAGAFHSAYMQPAADDLGEALAATEFAAPRFPVYANVTAAPVTDPRRQLAEQLVAPVRFSETLRAMADDGVDTFVHIGPGDVTAGLARRTVPEATTLAVSTLDAIPVAAEQLSIQ